MKIHGFTVVYHCTDTNEEEACFFEEDFNKAKNYIDSAKPPNGFEDRPGYYFIESSVFES